MQAMSDKTAMIIDEEVTTIINECYAKAEKILSENKDILENMKDALLKYETIDALQIDDLMNRVPVRAPTFDYDPAKNNNDTNGQGPNAKSQSETAEAKANPEEAKPNPDAPQTADDTKGQSN